MSGRLAGRALALGGLAAAVPLALALLVNSCSDATGSSGLTGFVPKGMAPVGSLALPEVHEGKADVPFHFKATPGHVLFVYFGYTTCPDVCPTTLSDLKRALRDLGPDARRVDVAFVTVDLERDGPRLLEPYLASFVHDAHPLRARTTQQLVAAENAFGASSVVKKNAAGAIEVSHSATSYLVDERGRIVDEWSFGTASSVMSADLRVLLSRAKS
jgi:protein SCO1/2